MPNQHVRLQNDTAQRLASAILNGFEAMFADFTNETLGAKARFEKADWKAVQASSAKRVEIYKGKVQSITDILQGLVGPALHSADIWMLAKTYYIDLLRYHVNYEIAETFYNSIYCFVFGHDNINDKQAFVTSSQKTDSPEINHTLYHRYAPGEKVTDLTRELLQGCLFNVPFENLERDIERIVEASREPLKGFSKEVTDALQVDVLKAVFYRSKAAYVIGRLMLNDNIIPFVLPLMHNNKGELFVDTVIFDPDELSVVFSFTRSFFMVETNDPSSIVDFLKMLMPHKARSELYACIGFRKHSKTEFFRDFSRHLHKSNDQFVFAPGIKGMVMSVFTLPSYDIVFKVIKDRFQPPKDSTREEVMEKYRLVSRHDRVGRMADTQEFSNFEFEKSRMSPELLEELYKLAPSLIVDKDENHIVLKHMYTERRMIPLNIYLQDASEQEIDDVMDEYGNAIKQLAAANIFPGDMLLKNFGVTRHKRVVFYDYDEIVYLTDCNFRVIPEPINEYQEMSGELWYTVEPNDVFPEEFRLFFSGNPVARKAFEAKHADLYDASYWQEIQENIRAGIIMDVFPYRRRRRFLRPV